METTRFSKNDTDFIKGIAIMLMLAHHLFASPIPSVTEPTINGTPYYVFVSYFSKVCVAMFLILSGYGLYESTPDDFSLKNFYIKRFSKLYINYWFIYLIFVPIGILFFNYGDRISAVYNSNLITALLDFFGLLYLWGTLGINPTWWFLGAIIFLYFLFPFLKVLLDRFKTLFFILSFYSLISVIIPIIQMDFKPFDAISWLLFPFILGMYLSQKNLLFKIKELGKNNGFIKLFKLIIYLALLIGIMYQRKYGTYLNDVRVDGFFAFIIILIANEFIAAIPLVKKPLIFLGKHSMNIFMFHTFIYFYFIPNIIYSFKSSLLIFIVLLSICVVISVILEWLKDLLKVNQLYKLIINFTTKV